MRQADNHRCVELSQGTRHKAYAGFDPAAGVQTTSESAQSSTGAVWTLEMVSIR